MLRYAIVELDTQYELFLILKILHLHKNIHLFLARRPNNSKFTHMR